MSKIYEIYAKLFAKPFFAKWNYRLFRLALSGMGILNYRNNIISGEKFFITQILPKYMSNKPVLFDVGANIGNYSKLLLKQFPEALIHIFEPHPRNYKKLLEYDLSSNAHINNLALSDERGSIELFDYKYRDGSTHASMYKGVIEDIHKSESISHVVEQDTLDNYIEEINSNDIDLLKIDVEGHELNVLKGAKSLINSSNIKVIHFEFNEMNIESNTFFKDFYDLLENYSFYRMLPNSLLPLNEYKPVTHEIFAYQNIVAIQTSLDKES